MDAAVKGLRSELDRLLLDADAIQRRVGELASRIAADFAGQTVTVVAVMDGGLFFVADLLRKIDLPVRLHTLSASSYHGGVQTSGEVRLPWPPDLSVKGEHVLLLDDILDTGLTLAAVRDRLCAQAPASLRIGVLLSKKRRRVRELAVDYVGFEIEDEFVVGYGMDYQGRFRNLPCIGVLKAPS